MSAPAQAAPKVNFAVANLLFFRLYQCSNLLHKNGTRHMSPFGATTQQWAVLGALTRALVRDKGMTVKELINFLMLSRQNLTAVLDRLEDRGWIARVADPQDGRNRLVRLAPEGWRVWDEMQTPIEVFYSGALSPLSEDEQAQFCTLLDKLRDGLDSV